MNKQSVDSEAASPKKVLSFRDLKALIREDLETHVGDWRAPGFRAVAVYRFGVWQVNLQPRLLRAPFAIIYRFLFRFIRNYYGIELFYTTQLGRRFRIIHQSGICIHGFAVIGDDCVIFQNATIGTASLNRPHDAPVCSGQVKLATDLEFFQYNCSAMFGANLSLC